MNITIDRYELTEGGNLRIWIKTAYIKDPLILNKPAIIDGSIRIRAIAGNTPIGETVYCPDGFVYHYRNKGFGQTKAATRLIELSEERDYSSAHIDFEIEPIHLWSIESKYR